MDSSIFKNVFDRLFYWFESIIYGSSFVLEVLNVDIPIGSVHLNLLTLLTFGGLTTYLVVAIVKWVIS